MVRSAFLAGSVAIYSPRIDGIQPIRLPAQAEIRDHMLTATVACRLSPRVIGHPAFRRPFHAFQIVARNQRSRRAVLYLFRKSPDIGRHHRTEEHTSA